MFSNSLIRCVFGHPINKPRRDRRRKRPRVQPSLEQLEKREVPTTTPLETATPFILAAPQPQSGASPLAGSSPSGYMPSQIVQAYGFNQLFSNGLNGSGQTIAIVDAYNDPNIQNDLIQFDKQFGLTNPSLTVLNQNGGTSLPGVDPSGGWEVEESLDVEWAHAVAPGANIVLVEANSPTLGNLMTAVQTAANLPAKAGLPAASVVSMSWGGSEFFGETSDDSNFTTPGVAFVAASGDSGSSGAPIYPAISPNVLAVGGTTLHLDAQGNLLSAETGWSGSGGGLSSDESQPSYQKGVVTQSSTQRANPDVAFDADPSTGFAVYDSNSNTDGFGSGPWLVPVGGTSDAAPQWAGLVAIADQGRASKGESTLSSSQLLTALYQMPASNFNDITSGNNGFQAGPGYDLVTGLGTPIANNVVNSLVGTSPSPPAPPSPPSPPTSTPPSITLNPTSVTVTAGATVSFTAAASGNPTPTVQWEINTNDGTGWHNLSNGGNVSGATTDKLTLTNVGISMSGDKFEAVFSNGVGSPATTSAATLTVTSPPPAPPPVAGLLPDGGFEQPVVGASSRSDPSGSPWTFFWTAGVAGNGSVLTSGNPNAPEGQQVGYLQNRYSMISQAVNLTTGNIYTINFEAAQAVHGQTNNQAIEVFVNDTPVGVITPTSSSYANYNTGSFYVTASGTYVITFVGLDPRSTALLDEVSLSASPMVAQRNQAGARESVALATGASSNGTAGANAAGLPGLSFQQIGLSLHDPLFTQGGANLLQHEIDVLLQPGTLTHTILALQQQAALGPLGALLKPDWLDPFLF